MADPISPGGKNSLLGQDSGSIEREPVLQSTYKVVDPSTFDAEIDVVDDLYDLSFGDDDDAVINANDLKPADDYLDFEEDELDLDHPFFQVDNEADPDWASKTLTLSLPEPEPPPFSVAPLSLEDHQIPRQEDVEEVPEPVSAFEADAPVEQSPSPEEQRTIARAEDKLTRFFNKIGIFRDFGGGLKSDDVVGIGHDSEILRINDLLKKARWGRDMLTRPPGMPKNQWRKNRRAASETVARLAAQDPKRFAQLFEMRKSPGGPKHGSGDQRHCTYALLYDMASKGASIEELERFKAKLVQKMDSVERSFASWEFSQDLYDALDDVNRGGALPRALGDNLGISTDPEKKYWNRMNFHGFDEAVHYTLGTANDAASAANANDDHLGALASYGIPERDAGFVMQHVANRLPDLESSPLLHPQPAEEPEPSPEPPEPGDEIEVGGQVQRDHVLKPGDENYVETYTAKMRDLLSVKNFRIESASRGIPHIFAKDEDIQDERMDKARAILYVIGAAHPNKVMNGELGPFANELCQLTNDQLDQILHLLDRNGEPNPDELFNDMKTLVEGQFREEQMNEGI